MIASLMQRTEPGLRESGSLTSVTGSGECSCGQSWGVGSIYPKHRAFFGVCPPDGIGPELPTTELVTQRSVWKSSVKRHSLRAMSTVGRCLSALWWEAGRHVGKHRFLFLSVTESNPERHRDADAGRLDCGIPWLRVRDT